MIGESHGACTFSIFGPLSYIPGLVDYSAPEYQTGEVVGMVASLAAGAGELSYGAWRLGVRFFGKAAKGGGQFRRIANTGAFSSLEVPMQMRTVKRLAEQAGVGLKGVKLKIVRDPELIGKGLYGHASEKGVITLYPDAFSSTENLVKTLGHERTHLMQFKLFGPVRGLEDGMLNERAAYGIEETFWQFFQGGR